MPSTAFDVLGFDVAARGDEVFRGLVLARIIEPVSKLSSLRVLEEAGVAAASYRTVLRRLPAYAKEAFRQELSAACAAHARPGPASLVLYDVSTLYFETDQGDGLGEPGFSKERWLDPQITIGLLTGQDGFPLMVSAFEGNKAETKTMLPVIETFMAAHRLPDVTVVADAGMISEASQKAIEAAGLSFILGMKIPDVPYAVGTWRREHPGEEIPDGHIFTQPWPAGPSTRRREMIYYQFRADRARRTLRGIDEQVAKAARDLAGLKGYVTNLAACPDGTPVTAEFVTGSYRRLFEIEKSFRMAQSDLQARPVYHHLRDSIEAHLTIVFAALASAAGSSTRPAGPSASSSRPPAATAPSRSRPDGMPSPPPTLCPPTSGQPSAKFTAHRLHTNLSQVPGGLRVVEAGPIAGLTAAGIPQDQAVAAVLIQRLFTSYLPPVWGWATLAWMRRREYV